MAKLCCISMTLAARFIGIFDLSASIFAINFIAAEFFADEKQLISFNGIEMCMDLIWANSSMYSQLGWNRKWILIFMMAYSTFHFICSIGLVLATLTRNRTLSLPWLTFELISLANLSSAVAVQICQKFQCICSHGIATSNVEFLPVASLYFLLCAYFWFIVFSAQKSWPTQSSEIFSESRNSVEVQWHTIDLNSPKNPVVVPSNYSIFESPKPPIRAKYYQLQLGCYTV